MKLIADMTEPELRDFFRDLARKVEAELPPGPSSKGRCLFLLLVDDGSGICQYVANAERSQCIKFLRETADRLASRGDVTR